MKTNYDKILEETINELKGRKPSLLLHSCCAPCSTAVITRLKDYFDVTIFYYNPNIEPLGEYLKRKEEQKRIVSKFGIKFLDCDYENEIFKSISKGLEDLPEGGYRCHKCYELRLTKTALTAKENNFEYFGTTLTVSPYKNSQVLNAIGKDIEELTKVKFLYSDFKKKEGYKLSIELSKKYNCEFDDRGNIGKRYRRQDEIGTPFCVTYDFDSETDGAVTIRDRDTMEQVRVNIVKNKVSKTKLTLFYFM